MTQHQPVPDELLDVSDDADVAEDLVYALASVPGVPWLAARVSGLYAAAGPDSDWAPAYGSLALESDLPTSALAVSAGAQGRPYVFAGVPGGVLRSTDGCATWQVAAFAPPPPAISALAVSPAFERDSMVLAGTLQDGVWLSLDGGSTYQSWNIGLFDPNVLCLAISPDFAADETVYAGTASGLFASTSGGRGWRDVPLAVGPDAVLCLAISPAFSHDQMLWIGTETAGLWRSVDAGATWQHVDAAQGEPEPINQLLLDPQFPARPYILALVGGEPRLSRDGGRTWLACDWDLEAGVTALWPLTGLAPGAQVLAGLSDGQVVCCTL